MIKRNNNDELLIAAQKAMKAQKADKERKSAEKLAKRTIGMIFSMLGVPVESPKSDIKAEIAQMVQKVEKAAKVRDAAVRALFAEVDNTDDSPVMVYSGIKATFRREADKGRKLPDYTEWLKSA